MRLLAALVLVFLSSCAKPATEVPVAKLHANIRTHFAPGTICGKPLICGNVVSVNCSADTDGPHFYYNNDSGNLIMACGGACDSPDPSDPTACKACPPKEWSCASDYN